MNQLNDKVEGEVIDVVEDVDMSGSSDTFNDVNKNDAVIENDGDEEVVTDGLEVEEDVESDSDESSSYNFDDGHWYIVQCFSGHEDKVLHHIQVLIDDSRYGKYLYRALVPSEETVEIKNNKRVEKTVRLYPGYVFIQMDPQDYVCYEIRKVPGVMKFIGGTKSEPSPVSDVDILKVLRKVGDKTKTIDVDFEENEEIKVIDGPFRGYSGLISEINVDRGSLKVKISIFGRETPVELNFDQVEKIV